jgi:glucokinase
LGASEINFNAKIYFPQKTKGASVNKSNVVNSQVTKDSYIDCDYVIGVDVGGTKVLGGVVDRAGKILETHREDTPSVGGMELTKAIANTINLLAKKYEVGAVGISIAGFISADRSTINATPNIANYNGVNLKKDLANLVTMPVVIENDANAAAWGEAKFGAGIGVPELIMVTVGTGIGGGFVSRGEIYRGGFGMAAEFGHMRLVPDGHICGCTRRGCIEQYASGTALLRHAREAMTASPDLAKNLLARGDGSPESITGKVLTQAAQEGDPIALAAFNTTAEYLGAAIASYCALFDPLMVVVGGGVVEAGDILMKPTIETYQRLLPFTGKRPFAQVVPALLLNDAGLIGAADLARSH